MSIIKPVSRQDYLLKERIQEASKKANLNLSEVLALNEKFGTKLEYMPTKDEICITLSANKDKGNNFIKECESVASEICQKTGKILAVKVNKSKLDTFTYNVQSALKKMKKAL